jgi:predicted phage-related endonuclease
LDAASLDGLSFDGSTVLEIKCPLSLRDRVSAQEGRIPAQYHAQLQHQLEVSRAELAHYWSFHRTSGVLIEIRPDREYARRLIDAEAEFWHLVKENRWPELANEELDLSAASKLASRRAALPRSQAPAGKRSVRGAPAARNAEGYGDSEADVRLWRRSLEKFAQRHG